ncbi:hypothetical protein M8818_005600 [Zalaria obscura]|uniref:Uncharacterized protein n=1 Tax=Zalaria obscura TaxID=2024903 RepID=A0ACC3S8E8_9PEZI
MTTIPRHKGGGAAKEMHVRSAGKEKEGSITAYYEREPERVEAGTRLNAPIVPAGDLVLLRLRRERLRAGCGGDQCGDVEGDVQEAIPYWYLWWTIQHPSEVIRCTTYPRMNNDHVVTGDRLQKRSGVSMS